MFKKGKRGRGRGGRGRGRAWVCRSEAGRVVVWAKSVVHG